MTSRPDRPPLLPSERYRFRRLTDTEMTHLCGLARKGSTGPSKALDALWALILLEVLDIDVATNPTARAPGWAADYSIAEDQYDTLTAAVLEERGLHEREAARVAAGWWNYAPSTYEPDDQ